MSRTYRLTPRALADLDAIASYTLERWGEAQVEAYLRALSNRFEWLAENPQLGKPRDDVAKGYRCYLQGRHLIFYIFDDSSVDIIGLPHRSMDIETFF